MNLDEIERLLNEDEPKPPSSTGSTEDEASSEKEEANAEGNKKEDETSADMDAMLDRDDVEEPTLVDESVGEGDREGGGGNAL